MTSESVLQWRVSSEGLVGDFIRREFEIGKDKIKEM